MKHRVWCKDKNEWESDVTLVDASGNLQFQHYGRLQFANMDNHVLQFGSGITDIKGFEIFEGDIVYIDSITGGSESIVEFIDGSFSFVCKSQHVTGQILNGLNIRLRNWKLEIRGHINQL